MAKSSYAYSVIEVRGRNCIVIVDQNVGMSVTNDIENVIKEIEKAENIEAADHLIVYKDSEGQWDGYDPEEDDFVHCGARTYQEAINTYINKDQRRGLKS